MAGASLEEHQARPAQGLRGLSWPERLMGLAAALLAASILVIVVTLIALANERAAALHDQTEARAARLAVYGLMQASIDAETGQRGYLLTNDRAFLAPYESGREKALLHLAQLREMTAEHPDIEASVARAEALQQQAFAELAAPIERRPSPAALREALNSSKVTMDALREQARGLLRDVEQVIETTRSIERNTTTRLYWLAG